MTKNFSAHVQPWIEEHRIFFLVLLLGLFTGLVYLNLVPPWQHYDEPTQFEYAWLIANRPGLPQRGDFDQSMRREIAASMVENNFFRGLDFTPNLVGERPIWIGISQIGELPLYYWIAALPLRLTRFADAEMQLKTVRLVSLTFYLLTILAAYGIAVELTGKNHPLRWLLPVSILLIPSFVDIMTAVNDDVGATAFFSLFLWAGVRLIQRGFSWLRLSALLFFTILCFWTKNTVFIAVLLAFIPLIFSIFRGQRQKYAWYAVAACGVVTILITFTFGDAAGWYRASPPAGFTRSENPVSPLGSTAIRISLSPNDVPPNLVQIVPEAKARELRGDTVTVGAWIWADQPAVIRTPILVNDGQFLFQEVQVDTQPKFFQNTAILQAENKPLIISLSPLHRRTAQPLNVYYDGLVLAKGNHALGVLPEFNTPSGETGIWDGIEFQNAIRNASGSNSWPAVRTWVDKLISRYFPGRPSLVMASLLEPDIFRNYYSATIRNLFESFWARFGWGHISLQRDITYLILAFFAITGLAGGFLFLWNHQGRVRWDLLFFLGLVVLNIWGFTIARGITSYVGNNFLVPVARYAYPAVIPTMLIIDVGWLEIAKVTKNYLRTGQKLVHAAVIAFLITVNIYSIYTILRYFQP